ncbi:MAG: nucleoside triphosphate pyrophosphohydrolase [Smithellaceae bacterium]|nr:nucleoside triphosphate pyrophosphohydrolase [Smithellaceae bacterium]
MDKLQEIIRKLRSPDGCLWDRKQTIRDVSRYLIEEAYEVVEAIEEKTPAAVKEELGDLLFQILFLACICEEQGAFNLDDITQEIAEKMIRRHPHVFGNRTVGSVEEIKANWREIKETLENKKPGFFDGIPLSLPALERAQRITARAAEVGFDWSGAPEVMEKVDEEIIELRTALIAKDQAKIAEETGDLLFTLVNLSRFTNVNAEAALRGTVGKFTRRFGRIEEKLAASGKTPAEATLAEMDALWDEIKKEEAP